MDDNLTLFIRYIDLDNNIYTVEQNTIHFLPFLLDTETELETPKLEEQSQTISEKEKTGLLQIIDIILRTHSIHSDKREADTALLSIKVIDVERRLIISKSKEQFALETYLVNMLK